MHAIVQDSLLIPHRPDDTRESIWECCSVVAVRPVVHDFTDGNMPLLLFGSQAVLCCGPGARRGPSRQLFTAIHDSHPISFRAWACAQPQHCLLPSYYPQATAVSPKTANLISVS
jgi:hypothetical protein